jgi:anti-anti-sigma factor
MRSSEISSAAVQSAITSTAVDIVVRGPLPPTPGFGSASGPTVVTVSGEIDASNSGEIETCILSLFAQRMDVLIDLTGVAFIGSCGLWAVVGLPQIGHRDGVGCAVVIGSPVDRLLRLVNHHRPHWVFNNLADATRALAPEGLRLAS